MITINGIEATSDATVTTTDTLHGKIGTDAEMADNSLYDLLGGAALKSANLGQRVRNFATVTSATPLTNGTLFTYTGSIEILHIIGRVTDAHPVAANTCKLTITPDALAAYDICATKDLTGLAVGTLLTITGTAAGAMVGTTAVGSLAPSQANSIVATCVTDGVISVVFSDTGNQAAAIVWELAWRPLSAGASVV